MLGVMHALSPKGLPEHVQPLMEWITEDISTGECEELAAASFEYRDVFSSGPEDMEQTDQATHTGEHHPIRLPLRRAGLCASGSVWPGGTWTQSYPLACFLCSWAGPS